MADLLFNFSYGTQANYDALETYDEGTLYFTTDTLALYKGENLYNGGVKLVASLPETPALGVLYILSSTWIGQIWTGMSWKVITKPFVTKIGEAPSDNNVPTEKAVVDYVTNAIANVTGGTGIFVTDINYNTSNNAIVVDKGGVTSEVKIEGMVHNASYDVTNRKVSLPIVNGTAVEFVIPEDKDLVVKAGKYNPDSEEIWLSIDPAGGYDNVGNIIKIPVAALIDEITVSNTSTVRMSYDSSNNTISANVIISADSNNALKESNGLFVNISNKLDKISTNTANQIVVTKVDGTITNSVFTIGGTQFTGNSNLVALESAVANFVNSRINEMYTNATNYTNTVNSSMKTYVDGKISNISNLINSTNAAMKEYVDNSITNAFTWKTF